MPPRKKKTEFDFSDLPVDVSELSEENKSLVTIFMFLNKKLEDKFSDMLAQRDERISSLEAKNKSLEKRIENLENKIDDGEAVSKLKNIIFSGPELPLCTRGEVSSNTVLNLLSQKFKLSVPPAAIISSKRIGRPPTSQSEDRRDILVELSDIDRKKEIIISCKRAKINGVYVREDLTSSRRSIMTVLRRAKRDFPSIIAGCSSIDGKVIAWLKPANTQNADSRNTKVYVNTFAKLEQFCVDIINVQPSRYLKN